MHVWSLFLISLDAYIWQKHSKTNASRTLIRDRPHVNPALMSRLWCIWENITRNFVLMPRLIYIPHRFSAARTRKVLLSESCYGVGYMTRRLHKNDRHICYFGEIPQIIDLKSRTRILFVLSEVMNLFHKVFFLIFWQKLFNFLLIGISCNFDNKCHILSKSFYGMRICVWWWSPLWLLQ